MVRGLRAPWGHRAKLVAHGEITLSNFTIILAVDSTTKSWKSSKSASIACKAGYEGGDMSE